MFYSLMYLLSLPRLEFVIQLILRVYLLEWGMLAHSWLRQDFELEAQSGLRNTVSTISKWLSHKWLNGWIQVQHYFHSTVHQKVLSDFGRDEIVTCLWGRGGSSNWRKAQALGILWSDVFLYTLQSFYKSPENYPSSPDCCISLFPTFASQRSFLLIRTEGFLNNFCK